MNQTQTDKRSQTFQMKSWKINAQGIEVNFVSQVDNDVNKICLPWMWLRDHCQCRSCFTATAQRECDVFIDWDDFQWQKVIVDTNSSGFVIQWHDKHISHFSHNWLGEMLNIKKYVPQYQQKDWTNNLPILDYHYVLETETGFNDLLKHLTEEGICKIIGAKSSKDQARQLMQRISYLRQSIFGNIIEIKPSINGDYDESHLHTDGAFNYDPPGIKLVQYIATNDLPCEMIFVDGCAVIDKMKNEYPQMLNLLQKSIVSHRYLSQDIDLIASEPIINLENNLLKRIRYNPKLQVTFTVKEPLQEQELQIALEQFQTLIEEEYQQKTISLNLGEIVIWDNWRILHGGSLLNGNHHFAVCLSNKEDFDSCVRVNQNKSDKRPVPLARNQEVIAVL